MVIVVVVIVVVMKVVVVIVVVVIVAVVIVAAVIVAVVIVDVVIVVLWPRALYGGLRKMPPCRPVRLICWLWLGCGARLLVIIACGSGAVHFSVVTGALVLHWLSFKHSSGGLRKIPPVAPFASYFGCGSGAAPGCSL